MNKINLIPIIFLLAFIALSVLLGCNSDTIKKQNIKSDIIETLQKETVLDSFSITISTAGGITGLGGGYTITSDGTVKYWKQLSFVKDTTLWKKNSKLSKILDFKNELDTCGILQKEYSETSNMTTSLSYYVKDTNYLWTWKGVENNIPIEINSWYKEVIEFCKKLAK